MPFHKICRWECGEKSKGFENDSHNLKMMLKREKLNIHKVREIKAYYLLECGNGMTNMHRADESRMITDRSKVSNSDSETWRCSRAGEGRN